MGTTQFAWDFENRLTQVSTPSSGSVTYKYDALGRRIERAPSAGASTNFIYDGQDVVQDVNSDATTVDYLNGPGIDNKISQTSTSGRKATTLYYLADHLGSTTALTNKQGHLLEQISYDSYGDSTGSVNTRYDYTGRERDSLTGLLHYRARWYDPQLGRFISEDPIGLAGGINSFAYVRNNPARFTDPSGLCTQNTAPTQAQTNARNLLGECRVHALLDTLAYSEGANYNTVVMGTVLKAPGHPELVGKTNVSVPDFSAHANILVQVRPGLNSTAAGRYQFLNRTWTGLGLPDFSEFNQDVGAVMLMQRRGMITPLLNGDVEQAIENGNAEWASLPGSPYGQGTRSMNSLKKVYERSFLNCVQAMHEIHQGLHDDNGV